MATPAVEEVVAVLPGGDVHARGRTVTQQMQPVQVVRRDRFLEPHDAGVTEGFRLRQRVLTAVGAVGIHVERSLRPDGLTGGAHPAKALEPEDVEVGEER